MPQFPSLTPVVVALVLMLNVTPSWGQPVCASPGCNPTVSDANANTAGGSEALADVVTIGATQGFLNTAFGRQALRLNTTGSFNIAIGAGTLQNNTSGNLNVANGVGALGNNTTGGGNTAIGNGALLSNTTGFSNTASGANSLNSNSIGSNNIAIGVNALFSNDSGNLNTANGFQALESNVAGTNNTAIGAKALKKSLGTKNIGIGFQAGVSLVNGNNNIYIGNQGAGDEFLTIRIGTAQTQTFHRRDKWGDRQRYDGGDRHHHWAARGRAFLRPIQTGHRPDGHEQRWCAPSSPGDVFLQGRRSEGEALWAHR